MLVQKHSCFLLKTRGEDGLKQTAEDPQSRNERYILHVNILLEFIIHLSLNGKLVLIGKMMLDAIYFG